MMSDNGHITWKNDKRKLSELIPWPRNPRQIKADQVKRLQESLDEFGQPETIAIGPGNEIYNGHQRLKSWADKYGDIEVDVRVSSRALTEKEREKLTVFLHKGAAGEWNFDILANEFEVDDLLDWGFEEQELDLDLWGVDEPEPDPGAQIDRAEELREKWGVESGQLWRLGEHRLICGDCTDAEVVERVMDDELINVVISSPPYFNQRDYSVFENRQAYLDFIKSTLNQALSKSSSDVVFCWNVGNGEADGFDLAADNSILLGQAGLRFTDKICWRKSGAVFDIPRTKHLEKFRYFPAFGYELIYIYRMGVLPKFEPEDKKIAREFQINVWEIKQVRTNAEEHPAAFPVLLPELLTRFYSTKQAKIYDPFVGSGTTLIACERLGRKCRAVEISPAYCAVAIQRWVDMTGQEPELLE